MTLDCYGDTDVEGMTTVEIGPDAEVVFPKLENKCLSTNSALVVNGGKLTVLGSHNFDRYASATGWRHYVGTHDLIVTNGGAFCQAGGETKIGQNGNQGLRFDRFTVTGAGSSYTVAATAGAWDALLSAELNVLDGGAFTFAPAKAFQLGAADSSTGTDELKLRVAGVGSTLDLSKASSFVLSRHTTAVFEDGAMVTLPKSVQMSNKSANDDTVMTIRGDGTKVLLDGANQCYFYPGWSAGKVTVNVEGGYLSAASGKDFVVRSAADGRDSCEFNISGGTVDVCNPRGCGAFYVAFRGNGTLNVSGGELKVAKDFLFNYETASGTARTSRFRMTGGKVTANEGVLMSNVNSADRRSITELDGGTLVTKGIFANNSVTAGNLAPADFSADGGTIVPNAATDSSSPFIQNLDTFQLGSKGLTVDTKAYATCIRQAIGNKSGEQGLLVKRGSATLTLAGGAYAASNARIEEGTLLLSDATPDFATSLSVCSNAVFSLEGTATGVTLTGLAVTNGTLRLDPTDVITVQGPVCVRDIRLSFTSLPTLETAADFLVADGELAPADARALRCAVMDAFEIEEGAYVEVWTTYDEQTGKTKVSVRHATEVAPIGAAGTVTWNGSGADWATAANWDGGVPTATKKAAFPETGVKTVNVAAKAKTGALAFSADGYTLTGAGSVEICADRGAAEISSSGGAALVDVPVILNTLTDLPVAADASLTLAKPVLNGGIRKSGAGSLILAASNEFERAVSVSNGLNLVKHAQALGVPSVGTGRATVGTGTLRFAAEDPAAAFDTGLGLDVVGGTATASDPAILDVRTPTSLASVNAVGSFLKRGEKDLTLDLRGATGAASVLTTFRSGAANSEGKPPQITPVSFAEDGTPSLADVGGFTVFEGGVVVKGDTQSPTVTVPGSFVVGYPVAGGVSADPALDVSGARIEHTTHVSSWATHFYLGYGLGQLDTGNAKPILRVTDGGAFICNTIHIGKSTYGWTACEPTVALTNATFVSSYAIYLSEVENVKSVAKWRCRNSTVGVTSSHIGFCGVIDAEFCGSYLGRTFADGSGRIDPVDSNDLTVEASTTGRVVFAEKSQFCCRAFGNFSKLQNRLEFVFDDSEWMWKGTGQENFTLPASLCATEKFQMTMRGKGLIVRPASGYTFTTEVPFRGEGGFQNLGAGTVKFNAGTYLFTGTCRVAEGATVDLTDAGTLSGATFGGAGTVAGGTFSDSATVALEAADDWTASEVPTFSNCALDGVSFVIDYGRTSANPLDPNAGQNVLVAKLSGCTGTPTFRLKTASTGLKGVRGEFTVDPSTGEVRMNVARSGFMMYIR